MIIQGDWRMRMPGTLPDRVIASAIPSRVLTAVFSVYMLVTGLTWGENHTRYVYGVEGLDIRPAFAVCGLGIIYALWPRNVLGYLWITLVGLACVGRFFTVILVDTYGLDEQFRAYGWVLLWLFAGVCTTQISAAEVLKRRRGPKWSG